MKDFLLIANKNCITYKEFFPFIKDRKVNIGYTHPGDFDQPEEDTHKSMQGLTRWFSTLSTSDKPPLILTKTYDPEKYPKYDNYDAINVDRVKDIPYDYDGVIGCPITILDHNLDNVEIIDLSRFLQDSRGMSKEFVDAYYSQGNTGQICEGHPDLCFYDKGKAVVPYRRVLIKKNFEIVWKGGDIEWAEQSDIFTPPPQDIQNEYKHNDETWRVQNPYITTNGKPYCPYNRIFIKKTLK